MRHVDNAIYETMYKPQEWVLVQLLNNVKIQDSCGRKYTSSLKDCVDDQVQYQCGSQVEEEGKTEETKETENRQKELWKKKKTEEKKSDD